MDVNSPFYMLMRGNVDQETAEVEAICMSRLTAYALADDLMWETFREAQGIQALKFHAPVWRGERCVMEDTSGEEIEWIAVETRHFYEKDNG